MKPMRVLLLAAALSLVAATAVDAQDSSSPDLGSGWERSVAEPMPVGTLVAGSGGVGFVARNFDGDVFTSVDGLEWEQSPDATGNLAVRDLAANDRGFVATLERAPATSALFSADGRTWDTVDLGTPGSFWVRATAGPGGFLVAAELECQVVGRFSSDGRDWAPIDAPTGCGALYPAPTTDGWIAVAKLDGQARVLSSADGVDWSNINETTLPSGTIPPLVRFNLGLHEIVGLASLVSDGDALVFAGERPEGVWVSVDEGSTWAMADIDPGPIEMAVSDLGFVGVTANRVLFSTDGTSWSEYSVEIAFHDIAAAGDTLVALAPDGIYTWTTPPVSLPDTGANTTRALKLGAGLIAIGAAVLAIRRSVAPSP